MGQRLIHPVTDAHFGNAMRFPDACVRAFSVYMFTSERVRAHMFMSPCRHTYMRCLFMFA